MDGVTKRILAFVSVVLAVVGGTVLWHAISLDEGRSESLSTIRFGISPFQDTLVPIVGREKGWYREEGLNVDFRILGWTEVMEALSAGEVDVAINNMSSVVATHERNSEIVYWYGVNPFDNGFALMIRPDGEMKTLEQTLSEVPDREEAIRRTAAQLRGRTVVTTSRTDMEQGVAAAARRGGLDFREDVRIVDLNPDEGLAAFLRGEGDAYIGGIPQRTRAGMEGMLEMLTGAELGPPPINGFVTTRTYATEHQDELLRLLRVWFRIVNDIETNMADGGQIVVDLLNANSGARFTLADFARFWNRYEQYPEGPGAVEALILAPTGRSYWKARWEDCNNYFFSITGTISTPVESASAFLMEETHDAYLARYGTD